MPDDLDRIADALAALAGDVDARTVADAVWLAATAPPLVSGTSHPVGEPSPDTRDQGGTPRPASTTPAQTEAATPLLERRAAGAPARGAPVRVPVPPPLPQATAIARALRPFTRPWRQSTATQLDVDATVDRYAEHRVLTPVLRTAPERWFDVVVVVDDAPTMAVWNDTVTEFVRVLARTGFFRAVHRWTLTDTLVKDHLGRATPVTDATVLARVPNARRLVLVVSDFARTAWHGSALWALVTAWARATPVALVNPLPVRFWAHSGMDLPAVRVRAAGAPGPNSTLHFRLPLRARLTGGSWLPVPALALTPAALDRWARTIVLTDPDGCDAVLVPGHRDAPPQTPAAPGLAAEAFLRTAAGPAARLALLSAPFEHFSLSLLRLLQANAVPEAEPADLAELLISGLATIDDPHAANPVLTYHPTIRDQLLDHLTADDVWTAHQALTSFIAAHPDVTPSMLALAHTSDGQAALPAELHPFAAATEETLRLIGGHSEGLTAPASHRLHVAPSINQTSLRNIPTGVRQEARVSTDKAELRLEVGHSGKPLVRVFLSFAHRDEALVLRLWDLLSDAMAIDRVYDFQLWRSDSAILVGQNWDDRIRSALSEAEIGVVALSNAFLASEYTSSIGLPALVDVTGKRVVPLLLQPVRMHEGWRGLNSSQIYGYGRSFSEIRGVSARDAWVNGLVAEVHRVNAEYRRDISVSHNRLGDLAVAAGDTSTANTHYQAGLDIVGALVAADPGNADFRRDLSVSHRKLGDLAVATGDTSTARTHYQAGLDIAEALAAADPALAGDEHENMTAMNNLGVLLHEQDEKSGAERWWRTAADHGSTDAMINLGALLAERGEIAEAERWLRTAADHSNVSAMTNLGTLLAERGEIAEAERWWRTAADHGNTNSMHNLGILLTKQGAKREAEYWYRSAADHDHPGAMNDLGSLLAERGMYKEAQHRYRTAADHDHPGAMFNLGTLLAKQGRDEQAEHWYRTAANHDHPGAMTNLGTLLSGQGKDEEAEHWYRTAANHDHPGAMFNLGTLLAKQGEGEEAEGWYRTAANHGNVDAMTNLGASLAERGAIVEAERWLRAATDQGNTDAMTNLGILLAKKDEVVEAEHWLRTAINHGNTNAMFSLGILLHKQGEAGEAEHWYRTAAGHGNTDAMTNLAILLRGRGGATGEGEGS